MTIENLKTVSELIGAVVGIFELRKPFKKEAPTRAIQQEGGTITIQSANGSIIQIDNRTINVYNENATIQKALDVYYETLERDSQVKDFQLLDKKERVLFKAERAEFPEMVAGKAGKKGA